MDYTIENAVEFIQWLEPQLQGKAHLALTGGILFRNASQKDCDIIVYPHQAHMPREDVAALIKEIFPQARNPWGEDMPYPPGRLILHVEMEGWKVDFFFLT